jgi:hypothetical protein
MEISSLANAASSAAVGSTEAAASTMMLRKALDMQQQTALSLLQSVPQPTYSNPPKLGNAVDVRA